MALHIVQSAPFSNQAWTLAQAVSNTDDVFVLICDGTYAIGDMIQQHLRVFALKEDALQRGITADSKHLIDYTQFLQLTATNSPIVNWG